MESLSTLGETPQIETVGKIFWWPVYSTPIFVPFGDLEYLTKHSILFEITKQKQMTLIIIANPLDNNFVNGKKHCSFPFQFSNSLNKPYPPTPNKHR